MHCSRETTSLSHVILATSLSRDIMAARLLYYQNGCLFIFKFISANVISAHVHIMNANKPSTFICLGYNLYVCRFAAVNFLVYRMHATLDPSPST